MRCDPSRGYSFFYIVGGAEKFIYSHSSTLYITGGKNLAKVEKRCEFCSEGFLAEVREVNRGNGKFCSLSCSSKSHKKDKVPNVECATCGEKLYRSKSRIERAMSKSGLFFCDRECLRKAQRLDGIREIHPQHFHSNKNYRSICFRDHKKECIICGEDNIVAVHHYDHNHSNNDPGNLVPLCPTHHQYVHSRFSDLVKDKIDSYISSFLSSRESI